MPRKLAPRQTHLTAQQLAFIAHFVKHWNATEAARAAGYGGGDVQLAVAGCNVLKSVKVAKIVSEAMRAQHITGEQLVARLSQQAMADLSVFYDKAGRFSWPAFRRYGYLVAEFTPPAKNRRAKLRLHPPHKAQELLARHFGLLRDRIEVSAPGGGPVRHEFRVIVEAPRLAAKNGETKALDV